MTNNQIINIRRPDDWHLHLRDGALLHMVLPDTARHFARAIIMPNLDPPVRTSADARAYRDRIQAALPSDNSFQPLMTLFLTDETDPADVETGFKNGSISACKLYPAHATTNSSLGVTQIDAISVVLARMEAVGVPLLIHGELVRSDVDIFDREAFFIDRVLSPLMGRFPGLRIVFEHITTEDAVDYVLENSAQLAATITPHHLILDRNDLFDGGLRPHHYCLPIPKRQRHRTALRRAIRSGSPKFFLGTDSAPHLVHQKESACGCAGVYNAPVALSCYAQVFEEEGALHHLEAFASLNGPKFYGLPVNEGIIRLEKRAWVVAGAIDDAPENKIMPFRSGLPLPWRVSA